MTPELWQSISALYSELSELSETQREARLAELAKGDPELHRELVRLLAATRRDGSGVVDHPALGPSVLSPFFASFPRLHPGELLAGRFEIVSHRGSGGMGEVYEAQDRQLNGRVALKLIRHQVTAQPGSMARFRREIATARQVTHRSVCRVYDFFPGVESDRGNLVDFLTMELLDGETLADKLKREAPLTLAAAMPILRQIANGLDAAHAAGIVHRDLKGSNVMLVEEGRRAVITDFGLARPAQPVDSATTASAVAAGTPLFMSPEQMEGAEVGPASDLYSFGVLMYQMATGVVPLQEFTPMQIAAKRTKEPARAPREIHSDVDQAWNNTILRCLAIDPRQRFATAGEAVAAIGQAPSGDWKPVTAASSTLAWKKPVAGIALASALAGASWWAWTNQAPPPLPPAVIRFYQDGTAAVADGALMKATRLLERSLQSAPGFLSARCRLAEAYTELDMRDRAQEQLLRVMDQKPRDQTEQLLCDGVRAALVGNWPRALETATQRAKANTAERSMAEYDLARWSHRANRLNEAAAAYQSIIKTDASQPGALLRLADLRVRQGKGSEAGPLLDSAAAAYQTLGNSEALGEVALIRSRSTPNLPEATKLAAQAEGKAREAGSDWLRVRAMRRRAELLRDQGEPAAYRKLAQETATQAEAAGLPAQAADALIDLGYSSFAQGKLDEAEPEYRRALQVASRFQARRAEARARAALAQWHMKQNQFAEADTMVTQALAFYRETGESGAVARMLRYRGELLQRQGDVEAAEKAFQDALEASLDSTDKVAARNRLAFLARQRGWYEEAAIRYRELAESYSRTGDQMRNQFFRIEYALMLTYGGRFAEASSELASIRSQKLASDSLEHSLSQAEAFWEIQQGSFGRALSKLESLRERALRTGRETDARALGSDLCMYYAEAGLPRKSVPLCERAFQEFAGQDLANAGHLEAMALNLLTVGDSARAATRAQEAIALSVKTSNLRNRWYNQLLLTQALFQAKNAEWIRARDAARMIETEMIGKWGAVAMSRYLSRPLIARRKTAVDHLQ